MQFSLRALMGTVLAVAIVVAFFVHLWREDARLEAKLDELRSIEGTRCLPVPREPVWVRNIVGRNNWLQWVEVAATSSNPAHVAKAESICEELPWEIRAKVLVGAKGPLFATSNLTHLTVHTGAYQGSAVTGCEKLVKCKRLSVAYLEGSTPRGASLANSSDLLNALADSCGLERLIVEIETVSERDARAIGRMSNLRDLQLWCHEMEGAELAPLSALSALSDLAVGGEKFKLEHLRHFASCKGLQGLNAQIAENGQGGADCIAAFPSIQRVRLLVHGSTDTHLDAQVRGIAPSAEVIVE